MSAYISALSVNAIGHDAAQQPLLNAQSLTVYHELLAPRRLWKNTDSLDSANGVRIEEAQRLPII